MKLDNLQLAYCPVIMTRFNIPKFYIRIVTILCNSIILVGRKPVHCRCENILHLHLLLGLDSPLPSSPPHHHHMISLRKKQKKQCITLAIKMSFLHTMRDVSWAATRRLEERCPCLEPAAAAAGHRGEV